MRLVTGEPLPRVDHRAFDPGALVAAKIARGLSTTIILPARDEAATIGSIVERIAGHPLCDEVVVVDDHSGDGTAEAAARAGARVVTAADVACHLEVAAGPGKGKALWKGLAESSGDLVAFCDADVRDFDERFVVGLLGPLLLDEDVAFVKAYYRRPVGGAPRGGGRVTELVARPVLHLLFPELTRVVQPLAGEFAAGRDLFESLPFVGGYGVDLALLVDAARAVGVHRVVQVDLGVRTHRNRPIEELGPMAAAVLMAALHRAGIDVPADIALDRPDEGPADVLHVELPPLALTRSVARRAP